MWKAAGFSYLKYSNIAAKTLRNVLKGDAKIQALKREELLLKQSTWTDGKVASTKSFE